jgi:hypothetical protein
MVRSKTKCFNFATHMARGKWTSVFATFLIMTTSCTTYLFPIFGYRQSMLSTLSTCNDIGILLGLVVEVIPTQFQAIILAYMSLYVYWSPCSEFLQSQFLLFIAFPFIDSMYLASMIISFALGAQLPLGLSIISDLYGLKHYAPLFNCGQVASPLGLYLLNN